MPEQSISEKYLFINLAHNYLELLDVVIGKNPFEGWDSNNNDKSNNNNHMYHSDNNINNNIQ